MLPLDVKVLPPVLQSTTINPPIINPPIKDPIKNNARFIKPSVEEIKEYCENRGNGINSQVFYDYYESKGWMIGRSPMKNWQAAVRTWESRNNDTVKKSEGGIAWKE